MKKIILNEGLVLDSLNLSKEEKSGLIFLHQRYKDKEPWEMMSVSLNSLVDLLEDELGFSFTTSVKLAKIYKTKRDFLFKEYNEKYYSTNELEIIYEFFIKYIVNSKNEYYLTDLFRQRIMNSKLSEKYKYDDFYVSVWGNNYDLKLSFYVNYSPSILHGEKLNYHESMDKRWKAVFRVDFSGINDMIKKGETKIDQIPVEMSINNVEYNFPVPELENAIENFNLPIKFDIDELNKNDVFELIFGENDSVFSHLEEIILEINSFI